MSRADRESAERYAKWLEKHAPRLGFVTLMSFLERLTPDAPRVGDSGPFLSEAILFRHDPSLTFSASDVTGLRFHSVRDPNSLDGDQGPLIEVTTSFLGLTGAMSPLPGYLAEEVAQEQGDATPQRAFLDLFHHRLLSLLYRALARSGVASETSVDGKDIWSRRLLALGGIDTYDEGRPSALPVPCLLRLLPLLAQRSRSARSLEVALMDVLAPELDGAEVHVQQFVGEWVDIEERMELGRQSHRLGKSAVLGQRVFDRSGKITLSFAPLSNRTYRRLLPGGELLPWVSEVVALFGWDPMAFDLELGLSPGAAPELRASRQGPAALGRDSWLGHVQERALTVHTRGPPFGLRPQGQLSGAPRTPAPSP